MARTGGRMANAVSRSVIRSAHPRPAFDHDWPGLSSGSLRTAGSHRRGRHPPAGRDPRRSPIRCRAGAGGDQPRRSRAFRTGAADARPLIARRLDAGDPVGTLIALFLHGVAVPERTAAGALDPLGLDGAERLRLVQIADGLVTA